MRHFPRVLLIAAFSLLAACATAPGADPAASEKEIMQRVQLLLERYARNDQAGVVAMLDPAVITMLGTQFNESIQSPAELRALMDRDFAQWGSAKFSDLRDVDVRNDGTLATAYLVMTWQAGENPAMPVRLTTTWRKVKGEWLLTQSASALPPGF